MRGSQTPASDSLASMCFVTHGLFATGEAHLSLDVQKFWGLLTLTRLSNCPLVALRQSPPPKSRAWSFWQGQLSPSNDQLWPIPPYDLVYPVTNDVESMPEAEHKGQTSFAANSFLCRMLGFFFTIDVGCAPRKVQSERGLWDLLEATVC